MPAMFIFRKILRAYIKTAGKTLSVLLKNDFENLCQVFMSIFTYLMYFTCFSYRTLTNQYFFSAKRFYFQLATIVTMQVYTHSCYIFVYSSNPPKKILDKT